MTVSELIAALQTAPPDAPVVIEDADTEWPMEVRFAGSGVGTWGGAFVVKGGGYGDLWEPACPAGSVSR